MTIDSHQHFWQYDQVRDDWITDEMQVIQRDFMPGELHSILDENRIDGCVAVQADQSEKETGFLLGLAEENTFIKGVVGWLDLQSRSLSERIDHFKTCNSFKGVRHILQAESKGFMLQDAFVKGVETIGANGLTYDILTTESQLEEVLLLIKKLPDMPLVIDHISKPNIRDQSFEHWSRYMKEIGQYEHVYVKLSGMVTEADWNTWDASDFEPYIHWCMENFGAKRLMFGSDWPVCLLAGSYDLVVGAFKTNLSTFSATEQKQIFGLNAMEFYNLM